MRVIAGRYKGCRLATPTGMETRPILDRVKASLFDWLGSRLALPGSLPPLDVCDLFCGAGSLGIEALSRGAAFCAFVERNRAALACLRKNLSTLGLGEEVVIVNRPAETWAPPAAVRRAFGLVFIDPPYPLSEDISEQSIMGHVLSRLGSEISTEPDALALWRHAGTCMLPDALPGGWVVAERRAWGTMAVTMLRRLADRHDGPMVCPSQVAP